MSLADDMTAEQRNITLILLNPEAILQKSKVDFSERKR